MAARYAEYFPTFIQQGIKAQLLDEKLGTFDLKRLGEALDVLARPASSTTWACRRSTTATSCTSTTTTSSCRRRSSCAWRWGSSINEVNREERAIEFYNVLSTFDFMSSTPTLFNSGTQRSQLSSCYLTTVSDDLDGIYEAIKENALLSKFAGGLGNDWTPVRALGAYIKGTNGKSQGVIPFLKVVSATPPSR